MACHPAAPARRSRSIVTEDHRRRADLLRTLGLLCGFEGSLQALPDGRIPDVLLTDRTRRLLFIGEAKATESPRDVDCYLRLRRYLLWADAFASLGDSAVLVALAVANDRSVSTWRRTLLDLLEEVGLPFAGIETLTTGPDCVLSVSGERTSS